MRYKIQYGVLNNDGDIAVTVSVKQEGNTSIDALMKAFEWCPQYERNRLELISVEELTD